MANDKAMTFCKKYDVDLVFASRLDSNFVYSDFVMFVDNISKGKLRKFFDSLNAKQDRIHLTSVSNVRDKNEGLELSTSYLKHYFSDESGVLNSHMKLKDEEIQTALAKKSAKKQAKIDLANKRKALTEEKAINEQNLKSAVEDLIRKSQSQD